MKQFLFTIVFGLQIAGVSYAQEKIDANKMAASQTELMVEKLNLSEEQKAQVETINRSFAGKQAKLMNSEGSMFSKMGEMKDINGAREEAYQEILTETQMETYEKEVKPVLRKKMRSKMKS